MRDRTIAFCPRTSVGKGTKDDRLGSAGHRVVRGVDSVYDDSTEGLMMDQTCCRFSDTNRVCVCGHRITEGFRCHNCGEATILPNFPALDDNLDDNEEYTCCPACGSPIDYCQGHGEIGDPAGHAVLVAHDNDDHTQCHPDADCHEGTE